MDKWTDPFPPFHYSVHRQWSASGRKNIDKLQREKKHHQFPEFGPSDIYGNKKQRYLRFHNFIHTGIALPSPFFATLLLLQMRKISTSTHYSQTRPGRLIYVSYIFGPRKSTREKRAGEKKSRKNFSNVRKFPRKNGIASRSVRLLSISFQLNQTVFILIPPAA